VSFPVSKLNASSEMITEDLGDTISETRSNVSCAITIRSSAAFPPLASFDIDWTRSRSPRGRALIATLENHSLAEGSPGSAEPSRRGRPIFLNAGCLQRMVSMAIERRPPGEKFFGGQPVQLASLGHRQPSAVHGSDDQKLDTR
jgi:hypothetical protein